MKRHTLFLAGGLLALLASCESSDYEMDNLVPDEYHKILYLNNAGEQELTLYDTGEPYTYQLSVVKVGSDPTLPASADLRILTQAEVDEQYGQVQAVNYQVIPETAYSLAATHVDFAQSERYHLVDLTLDPTLVKTAMEGGEADAQWVLPVELTSEADSVNADMNQLFLQITGVITPSFGFTSTDVVVANYEYGVSSIQAAIGMGLDTDNSWDIEATLAVGGQSLIDEYNGAHGTSFAMLPAAAYTLPATFSLPAGTTTADLTLDIDATQLQPGDYMLPVQITGVSLFNLQEDASVYLLAIRLLGQEIDRSAWTGEANTDEPSGEGAGNGVIECAFDGNEGTYWHSRWQGGSHALPHVLTIDTHGTYTFTNFSLKPRSGQYCGDTGGGNFYVSEDGEDWTLVGTFVMNGSEDTQYFGVTPTTGRYFRIEITQGNRDLNTNVAEVYAFGVQ